MKRIRRVVIIIALCVIVLLCLKDKERKETDLSVGWNLLLVNDNYLIPENYEIDLWTLKNGERIDSRIYPYLQEMFEKNLCLEEYLDSLK